MNDNYSIRVILDMFSDAVKEGKYKKMPYGEWREWLKDQNEIAEVSMTTSYNDWASVITFSSSRLTLDYFSDDASFGSFLYDLYCRKEYYVYGEPKQVKSYGTVDLDSIKIDTSGLSNAISNIKDALATTPKLEVREDALLIDGKTVEEIIDNVVGNSVSIRKENDDMNMFKNFDFGSCENDNVRVSMYGIAVKNASGAWVSYDPKSETVIDVDILNFDGKYLYKMPVALKDIAKGDVVIHNRKPMFVSCVDGGKILAIDPAAGEEKVIMLTRNVFGFDFATKVVNLFAGLTGGANADQPFGNMLPLILMNESKDTDMLPLLFMMNGGNFDMSNPMMLYFLMKDGKNNDLLPLMFLANGGKCACGQTHTPFDTTAANS